jgi:hypothetical protein
MWPRFRDEWVYGGTMAGLALLVAAAGLRPHLAPALLAVFLLLPAYMLHQLEEHYADRFRLFVNSQLGGGRELLTRGSVFVINVPGVWGVYAAIFALAATSSIGFGLAAAYTTLVNAIVHIAQAVHLRRANPGLFTGVLLFLPASIVTIRLIAETGATDWRWHALGIAVALLIHASIVAYAASRWRSVRVTVH